MPRRRPAKPQEVFEEEEMEMDQDQDQSGNSADEHPSPQQTIEQELATKLVRYALSCEYSRTPIKRQAIRDKILMDHPRAFRKVFALAQQDLREVYGFEMRELPVKEKLTLEEKRKAIQSQSGAKSSETWILYNLLPKELKRPPILAPSKAPTAEREATYLGFYSMIICIIALTGGEISEQQLFRHLARANADSMLGDQKTDDVLSMMEKHGYIVRRVEQVSVAEDKSVSYRVGPRGKVEVGNQGVANMVRTVYGGSTPELEKKIAVSLGIQADEMGAQEQEQQGQEEDEEAEAAGPDTRRRSGRRLTQRNLDDSD